MDFRLNNGKPKCTVIQRFDSSILLIGPGGFTKAFEKDKLGDVKPYTIKRGWEINIWHLFGTQKEKG